MKSYLYYIYHDGGYYEDDYGRYDDVWNFRKYCLKWCIDYMNSCRAGSSPPIPPVNILKIRRWHCGKGEWVDIPK